LAYNIGKMDFHLLILAMASLPFDQLAIDLARLLSTSNIGYQYILVYVNIHTWFVLLQALKTNKKEIKKEKRKTM
jgi:hypothetical protein